MKQYEEEKELILVELENQKQHSGDYLKQRDELSNRVSELEAQLSEAKATFSAFESQREEITQLKETQINELTTQLGNSYFLFL